MKKKSAFIDYESKVLVAIRKKIVATNALAMGKGKGNGRPRFFRQQQKKKPNGEAKDKEDSPWYFTFSPEKWNKSNERVEVNLSKGRSGSKVKFQDYIYKFNGTETLEMFLRWWINLDEIVFSKEHLKFKNKLEIIDRCTGGVSQDTVRNVIKDVMSDDPGTEYQNFTWENELVKYHLRQLRNIDAEQKSRGEHEIRVSAWYEGVECIERDVTGQAFAVRTTRKEWTKDPEVTDEKAEGEYQSFILFEIRYRLIKLICGEDVESRRIYVVTTEQLREFKCTLNMGIKDWWTRFKDFQKFLPLLTWDTGNKRGRQPVALNDEEICELLRVVLSEEVLKYLKKENWDILDHPESETRDKIKTMRSISLTLTTS